MINHILHIAGGLLHNIPLIKHVIHYVKQHKFAQWCLSIALSVCLSVAITHHLSDRQVIDHVRNSAKIANTRLWLENVVDQICQKEGHCTTIARSFAYHKDKPSGTWCMGHRNMFLDKDYLNRKEIYIDNACKNFLERNSESSVPYDIFVNKCHDLAKECIFYDTKHKNNDRAFVLCKLDTKIHNAVSCVALVNGHNLDKYLPTLEQFKLNPDLSFFGD